MILLIIIGYIWLMGSIYFTFKDFDARVKTMEKYVEEQKNNVERV